MVRMLWTLALAFILSSCAKSNNFGFEHLDYQRVQRPPRTVRAHNEPPTHYRDSEAPPPTDELDFVSDEIPNKEPAIRVVRNSNHIDFTVNSHKSRWERNTLVMAATVKVGNDFYEDVEFIGVEKDSEVVLETDHPSLKDKLKANLICLQRGNCSEFFIDVFYHEENAIYHDQIIATLKQEQSPLPPVAEESEILDTEENKIIIDDEIKKEHIIDLGYVGLSEQDISDLFNRKEPSAPEEPAEIDSSVPSTPKTDIEPGMAPEPQAPSEPTEPSTSEEKKKQPPAVPEPPLVTSDKPGTVPKTPATPAPPEKPAKVESGEASSQKEVSILERLRVKNQVFEMPNNGWLERATDFLKLSSESSAFFFITKPQSRTYYGSGDLARLLYQMGLYLNKILPGRKLAITEISALNGGKVCWKDQRTAKTVCHKSHQNGVDADIRYLTHDDYQPSNVVDGNGNMISTFKVYEQFRLFMRAVSTKQVDVIFVGSAIKREMCKVARQKGLYKSENQSTLAAETLRRLYPEDNHTNHYHVRAKCSSDNRRCRRIEIAFTSTGC